MFLLNIIMIFILYIVRPVYWVLFCIIILSVPIIDILLLPYNNKIIDSYSFIKKLVYDIFKIYPLNYLYVYIEYYNNIIISKLCSFGIKIIMSKLDSNNMNENTIINIIKCFSESKIINMNENNYRSKTFKENQIKKNINKNNFEILTTIRNNLNVD